MTNAELISMVRSIAKHGADWRINEVLNRAADALEATDKRIDGLQKLVDINTDRCEALRKQLRESHESYEKRIAELEKQMPKEGEWIVDKNGYPQIICSICDVHIPMVAGWCMDAHIKYCPNCGVRMKKGESDEQ